MIKKSIKLIIKSEIKISTIVMNFEKKITEITSLPDAEV